MLFSFPYLVDECLRLNAALSQHQVDGTNIDPSCRSDGDVSVDDQWQSPVRNSPSDCSSEIGDQPNASDHDEKPYVYRSMERVPLEKRIRVSCYRLFAFGERLSSNLQNRLLTETKLNGWMIMAMFLNLQISGKSMLIVERY